MLCIPGGVFSKEQEVKILSFGMIVAVKYIMRVTKKQNLRVNKISDKCTSNIFIKNCSTRLVTYLWDELKEKSVTNLELKNVLLNYYNVLNMISKSKSVNRINSLIVLW